MDEQQEQQQVVVVVVVVVVKGREMGGNASALFDIEEVHALKMSLRPKECRIGTRIFGSCYFLLV